MQKHERANLFWLLDTRERINTNDLGVTKAIKTAVLDSLLGCTISLFVSINLQF